MGKNRLHVEKYKAPNERPNTSKADSSQKWLGFFLNWLINVFNHVLNFKEL